MSRYLVPAAPSVILIGTAAAWWLAPQLVSIRRRIVGKPPVSREEASRVRTFAVVALTVLALVQNAAITARTSAPHARRHTRGLLGSLGSLARNRLGHLELLDLQPVHAVGRLDHEPKAFTDGGLDFRGFECEPLRHDLDHPWVAGGLTDRTGGGTAGKDEECCGDERRA